MPVGEGGLRSSSWGSRPPKLTEGKRKVVVEENRWLVIEKLVSWLWVKIGGNTRV